MRIQSLQLKNFRNHAKQAFEFPALSTAIIGHNAAGKTNILEALYLLSSGSSIKANKEEELIMFSEESCYIEALIDHNNPEKLSLAIAKSPYGRITKQFAINGVKKRRMDFIGTIACVLFTPQDIELVIDSPSIRREYINTVLTQVDKEYRICLSRYDNALRRRNKILYFIREGKARPIDLEIWDQILIDSGIKLINARVNFFQDLNTLNETFPHINWQYVAKEISLEKLQTNRNRDIEAAQTLSGPHRDDFKFFDTDRDLSLYGSRGEQRLAVLALKLAELSFVAGKIGERPILLLDDIFSELDEQHRQTVLDLLGKQQTILTSTEADYFSPMSKEEMTVIQLL